MYRLRRSRDKCVQRCNTTVSLVVVIAVGRSNSAVRGFTTTATIYRRT